MGAFIQFLNRCVDSCEGEYIESLQKDRDKYKAAVEILQKELWLMKLDSDFMGRWKRGKFLKEKLDALEQKAKQVLLYEALSFKDKDPV